MVIAQKCNCCVHEKVCGFKDEYEKACTVIRNTAYPKGPAITLIKDSDIISVNVTCKYMKPVSLERGITIGDS